VRTDIISCPHCFSRYVVPQVKLAPPGRTVRCRACGHSWFEAREGPIGAVLGKARGGEIGAASAPTLPVARPGRIHRLLRDERGSFDPFAHRPPFQPRGLPYSRAIALAGLLAMAAIAAYLLWKAYFSQWWGGAI
jgi:predicted Zn finger-like uncharacterized protein